MFGFLTKKSIANLSIPKLLVLSFFVVILTGTILLQLPISNNNNNYTIIDSLFTATTSTCVTGLVTLVIKDQYSLFGQIIVMLLIQVGGLGLMTIISLAMLFIRKKLEFKQRLIIVESLNKDNVSGVSGYIKDVIKYSLIFEFIGMIIFAFVFIPQYGFLIGLFKSLFLSVSAFCNAGIDILGANSLIPYQRNIIVNFTVEFLIIMGGLGYAVWFDLRNQLKLFLKAKICIKQFFKKLRIHTKIVINMTIFLLVSGTILILIFEYSNTLKEFNFADKVLLSFFNSTTLRTAGFSTIDYSKILNPTKLLMVFYMFIGGSPGGTAGGIKTTTFFLLILMIYTQIKNSSETLVYRRSINQNNFLKAYTIFGFYFGAVFISLMLLGFSDSKFLFIDLLFEIVSAIGTVGLSIGITPYLSIFGKLVIIFLMFIGRVGPITIAYSLYFRKRNDTKIKHPSVDVIAG